MHAVAVKITSMKPFTKEELISLGIIFAVLFAVALPNFALSIKRGRDTTRKNDFGSLVNTLNSYQEVNGSFPLSSDDGKIVACLNPGEEPKADSFGKIINFIPCEWGSETPYLASLPDDPQKKFGLKYVYISNGRRYQIYGSLEDKRQDEYDEKIIKRNISCGTRVCNYGRSYGKTPLDISIEEYENQIYAK